MSLFRPRADADAEADEAQPAHAAMTEVGVPGPDASDALPLVRLLQLASPGLPIGAYSYSQGMEWAVEAGIVRDAATASTWIGDLLESVIARGEAPLTWRLLCAVGVEWPAFRHWNAWYRASRETAELRAETEQTGQSLLRLALDLELLDLPAREVLPTLAPITLPAAFALTARGFGIATTPALTAHVWAWLENQVLAAIKLVPLGQVSGQRMLMALGARIPSAVKRASTLDAADIATFAPGLALASARHETQYTRLFRS